MMKKSLAQLKREFKIKYPKAIDVSPLVKVGTMRFGKNNLRYRHRKMNVNEVIDNEVRELPVRSRRLTIIDEQGKESSFLPSHVQSAEVKIEKRNGKEYVLKTYMSTMRMPPEEVKKYVKWANEHVAKGMPLVKYEKVEVKNFEPNFTLTITTQKKEGDAIDLLYNVTKKEKQDILEELDIALKKFKKFGEVPLEADEGHILYNKDAAKGDRIKFIKAKGFIPYNKTNLDKIKDWIKEVLQEKSMKK